jgi:hypothetical protein
MKATQSSRSRVAPDESLLCQFPFADGRRCRMLRYKGHPSLCFFHSREELERIELEQIAAEISPPSGEFTTVSDIERMTRKLFQLVATNRIPIRNVQVLAHLAQLLLHCQRLARREITSAHEPISGEPVPPKTSPASAPKQRVPRKRAPPRAQKS